MPFTSPLWPEARAGDGLVGIAAAGDGYHTVSGDDLTLKDHDEPFMIGFGGTGDTKPQGVAIDQAKGEGTSRIYGPAGMNFFLDGFDKGWRKQPKPLVKGDTLTGLQSSTNVNEGSLVVMDLIYGRGNAPARKVEDIKYKDYHTDLVTITSANAVTLNDAAASLPTLLTNGYKWIDLAKKYDILATIPCISAATFGGVASIRNISAPGWSGLAPGLIVNSLSAVTFNPGGSRNWVPEPIPFDPVSPPTLGMCATSAGAITFGILFGEK